MEKDNFYVRLFTSQDAFVTRKQQEYNPARLRWFWIRHAPVSAREGIFTGASDVPANIEDARTEIKTLANALPQHPDLWITSTLLRARQTTQALRKAQQAERTASEQALCEQDFNEQNFGDWEEEPYDETRHRALWQAPATHRPPNGESFKDLVRRVAHAIERIEDRHRSVCDDRNNKTIDIVAVAHAGTIRAALAQSLQLSPRHALACVVDPLSLTRIDRFGYSRQDEKEAESAAVVRCVNVRQR